MVLIASPPMMEKEIGGRHGTLRLYLIPSIAHILQKFFSFFLATHLFSCNPPT